MKKNIVLLALIGVLATSLSGCVTKNTPAVKGQPPNATSEKLEEENVPKGSEEVAATNEILTAGQYDATFQLGNQVITLPATCQAFLDAGAVLSSKDGTTEDFLMNPGDTKSVSFIFAIASIDAVFTNTSEEMIPLKEAEVAYLQGVESTAVFFPKGVSVGNTLSQLTAAWGEPNQDLSKSHEDKLTYFYGEHSVTGEQLGMTLNSKDIYSATGRSYNVILDKNTGEVVRISCRWNPKTDELTTLKAVYDNAGVVLEYKMPTELTATIAGTVVATIDDVEYLIKPEYSAATSFLGGEIMYDYSASEEALMKVFLPTNAYETARGYDVTIIESNEKVGRACGFLYTEGKIECLSVYLNRELKQGITVYNSQMVPINQGDIVTEGAKEYFAEFMKNAVKEVNIYKAN